MSFRVATLNLYHWAAPGIGWYRAGAVHSPEGWALKRAWLAATLAEMDADLVGFQEVVSVEDLAEVCAEAGLPHFSTVAAPHFRADAPPEAPVYNRPVQAVAGKAPFISAAAVPPKGVAGALGVSTDRDFRRAPLRVTVERGAEGPLVFYCCHLKSPGVGAEDALISGASSPPQDAVAAVRWRHEGLARAHAAAAIQRVFEAAALHHLAMADLAEDPARPVFVVGDLNDVWDSSALRALTAHRAFERDGGAADGDMESEDKALQVGAAMRFRLMDAWAMARSPAQPERRPPTHRAAARGETIDFILASTNIENVTWRVHDRHFIGGSPADSSDHAGVSVCYTRPRGG